jgi:hypothetical protein
MAIDQTEERMKAFLQEMEGGDAARRRQSEVEIKEEAERGRRGIRS